MHTVEQSLTDWNKALLSSIPVGGLFSRNPVAHKWKALFRALVLREAAFWRIHDLMAQSYALHQMEHALGARILLRSGLEALATLIRLNQLMCQVLDGSMSFHEFGKTTSILLLGSRDGSTEYKSINILTTLQKCEKTYPGIERLYASLSESAHPNYEGILKGYSKFDHDQYETQFSNRWAKIYGVEHLNSMSLCMKTFQHEYDAWPALMEKLERWVEANDAHLEATKTAE